MDSEKWCNACQILVEAEDTALGVTTCPSCDKMIGFFDPDIFGMT